MNRSGAGTFRNMGPVHYRSQGVSRGPAPVPSRYLAAMKEASSQDETSRLEEQARKIVMKIWPYTTGRTKSLGKDRIKASVALAISGKKIGYKGKGIGPANWNLSNRRSRAYQIINKAFGRTPGAFAGYPTQSNKPAAQNVAAARKAAANKERAEAAAKAKTKATS